ncbi:1,2-dihydroxy-3-keto-5-methylthiopentene dioxygenase [Gigaspora margarita]|uniref:Acireductone dioxygenase n=1 Tax=Gigaspora margarita TaxID=4874 RepID=A0A8H4A9R8_GIGMA|nr:1,2-dihydroxy-3-keto-5-methylthiopentene dioxygenase [Gigaspora margarita]
MRAYYYDNKDTDPREPHEQTPLSPVTPQELANIGVLYWQLGDDYLSQIDKICEERNYKNRDELTCSKEGLGDAYESKIKTFFEEYYYLTCSKEGLGDAYESKIKTFFEEHLHEDEEIRYVIDGSGYFDVRDGVDRWIRIAVSKGDLLVLPEGIYHRFTLDTNDYIKVIRLFKEEPKWIPINRPADENPSRLKYLNSLKDLGLCK